MKPEQENFEPLTRLLKLKRYEQPPPRYFNDFSSRVIGRIRVGEADGREGALDSGSWLARLWSLIEAKPMLPGAIGVAICTVLVFGVVVTETTTSAPGTEFIQAQPASSAHDSIFAWNQNQGESRTVPVAFTNTNPVIRVGGGSLFDQIPLPPPELVSRPFGK
jgi:hypothetical protein